MQRDAITGLSFAVGQCWTYRAPPGFEHSRLVIGAIVTHHASPDVVCVSVLNAPQRQPDASIIAITVPFLPLSVEAMRHTVTALAATDARPAEAFRAAYEAWRSDPRGLSYFSVPFEGFLDQLVARQMAAIAGVDVDSLR